MSNLNRLPAQALLNPKLAMAYLFKSRKRAAAKKLSKNRIQLVDPSNLVSIYEPPEMIALDEHSDSFLEDQLPDEIKTLPDFELFRQRAFNKRSLAELGKDRELPGKD